MASLQAQIEEWLGSKGVTLWSTWNIQDPMQRREAAAWFAAQQDAFDMWLTDRLLEQMEEFRVNGERFDVV